MSSTNSHNPFEATEAEIADMTADLADAHHDSLPRLHEALEESWGAHDEERFTGLTRRSFLTRTGLVAAGGLLVATTSAGAMTMSRGVRGGTGAAAPLAITVAALAASLENLAVSTYGAALSAAKAGKLGTVPAAIGTFATTAMAQHKDHAAAWNAIVKSAGYRPITAPNATYAASVDKTFAAVTNVAGVANLALSLEEIAAATYLEAIQAVNVKAAIATAATIQPVEMQHVAILNFVLGKYPAPASYSTTTLAAKVSAAPSVSKA